MSENKLSLGTFDLYLDGEWVQGEEYMEVLDKYTLEAAAKVTKANQSHVDRAIDSACEALEQPFSAAERYNVLMNAAKLLQKNRELLARTITIEVGKPYKDSLIEVDRSTQTLIISAEEAKRITGEGIPVEAAAGSENRLAFSIRVPVGVIAAITPFNVPLNLVCHKVGPALAAGNSVILKPSEVTPVISLQLANIFAEAGLPKGRLNVITGDGPSIGEWLIEDNRVRMFSFTGSVRVGEWIRERAGLRKVALELGNNSANIVHSDCDLEQAIEMIATKGFNNAGQVCISVQRVFVHEAIKEQFLTGLKERTEKFVVGNPNDNKTDIGPMISIQEAERVEQWVQEAIEQGADLIIGGERTGAFYSPTILDHVKSNMKVCRNEVFGPVLAIDTYTDIDEAIAKVNNSDYGLQAGIFTKDLNIAMKAARKIEVGGLIVNDASAYRVDHMPYGGVKNSGTGKEGPAYAIKEMTEEKLIILNL